MGYKYVVKPPGHYPLGWHNALAAALASPGRWISIDFAESEAGATNRMRRLRAFRDSFIAFPGRNPQITARLAEHLDREIRFRVERLARHWDVQVAFRLRAAPIGAILKQIARED